MSYDITYLWNLLKSGTNELIYKIETDSQKYKTFLRLSKEKIGGGINNRIVHYTDIPQFL